MSKSYEYDAVVIGSGPNGLAAAITLAKAGHSVILFESKNTIGGGMRSAELTLPGFIHDVCSAIHPLAVASPFFKSLNLEKFGLEWIQPQVPLAHPFDDGTAVLLERSIEITSQVLGKDAKIYKKLMENLVKNWNYIASDILGPLRFPSHPIAMAEFAALGLRSSLGFSNKYFQDKRTKGLFAGLCAHSILPLDKLLTSAFGLILAILGHTVGWPLPKGGTQKIANALADYFSSLGGKLCTDKKIDNIDHLPSSRVILCDISPKQMLQIAGHRLPNHYNKRLSEYRYGPGVFKIDWAMHHPIPWKAKACSMAGTVHVGGTEAEIAFSEKRVWENDHSEKPFVLVAQPSLFDSTRAPVGKHTAWGYCHVPHGSNVDMTSFIENQLERFAPGFKDCILAKNTMSALDMEIYNPNDIGGTINGGVQDIFQLFNRPVGLLNPYATPLKGLYFCSASTPPGGGVHGMCGFHAATIAKRQCLND